MNSQEVIAQYLDQWLHLTQRESQTIQTGDWAALTTLHAAKEALKNPLRTALARWRDTRAATGKLQETEPFFGPMVDRLLALETQNLNLLAGRKQSALDRKLAIEQSARNLRMVRDSYARKPATAWQVYS